MFAVEINCLNCKNERLMQPRSINSMIIANMTFPWIYGKLYIDRNSCAESFETRAFNLLLTQIVDLWLTLDPLIGTAQD